MPEPTTPATFNISVHLNGTSAEALIDQRVEAIKAGRAFLDKLADARPHPRDFYVQQDPDAFKKAQAIFQKREADVKAVVDALVAEMLSLQASRH